ncbi:hypothetical protein Tco_0271905 [Tanacetum coccineum]
MRRSKKRKLGTRRKLKAKRRKYTSGLTREDDDLKMCLHIAPDEDKVIDVEILDHQYPIVEWKSFYFTTKLNMIQPKPIGQCAYTHTMLGISFEDSWIWDDVGQSIRWGRTERVLSFGDNTPLNKCPFSTISNNIRTNYVQEQMTAWHANQSKRLAGKELSNPFIADDLLKIIWSSFGSKSASSILGGIDLLVRQASISSKMKSPPSKGRGRSRKDWFQSWGGIATLGNV